MAEYIEREAAIKSLFTKIDEPNHAEFLYCDEIYNVIQDIPAADVAPVKHGRWGRVDYGNGLYNYHCSSCRHIPRENIRSNYCTHCGAKMDGGVNDADL